MKKIEILIRNILGWLFFIVAVFLGVIPVVFTYIFKEKRIIAEYARWVIRVLLFIFGVRVELKGIENLKKIKGKFLIVGNHQSYLDPVALFSFLKGVPRFFVRHDVFSLPIIGHGLKIAGFIPVERKHPFRAKDSIYKGLNYIEKDKAHDPVVIFPEGTRTKDGKLRRFKRGAFLIAKEKKIPILPVIFKGFFYSMPRGEIKIKPNKVFINFLEPIYPDSFKDKSIDELAQFVKEKIETVLEKD